MQRSIVSTRHELRNAVGFAPPFSRESLLNAAFVWLFKGLVYPQIWEDPEVDLEALEIDSTCHVVTIASGGCNVLSYLIADPAKITAVDLNGAHVALNRLKLAAARHLVEWPDFYRFFGRADRSSNLSSYDALRPHLDAATRAYWERRWFGIGRRRVSMFSRNFYRFGLLGRFIGLGHFVARRYGVDPSDLLRARSVEEQRVFFRTSLAPLFKRRLVRWVLSRRFSLFGLGIPPSQHKALAAAGHGDVSAAVYERLERLSCGFAIEQNYFAWQAFGRGYSRDFRGPLPPYLCRENFETLKARSERVEVLHRSFTEYLQSQADASLDRYVLLDAQDWMSDAQLNALWFEITRTARAGARVIFRTAAAPSLLPGRVANGLLSRWRYEAARSEALSKRDRSAIYGGFHLYVFQS